jgi:hypothetical protein
MASRSIGRALGLGIFIMIAPTAGKAAAEAVSCRHWGLGWGDASLPYDVALRLLPGLRYRTADDWQFTLSASFDTDDEESARLENEDDDYSYDEYGELTEYDYVARTVALNCSRQFRLHPRLSLGPVLRAGHSYARSERTDARRYIEADPFDWTLYDDEATTRREVYWIGLGLRPQFWPHSRASVEAGLYLDYQHGQRRTVSENRREAFEEDLETERSRESWTDNGWHINTLTPSVSMGLTLFFYF